MQLRFSFRHVTVKERYCLYTKLQNQHDITTSIILAVKGVERLILIQTVGSISGACEGQHANRAHDEEAAAVHPATKRAAMPN